MSSSGNVLTSSADQVNSADINTRVARKMAAINSDWTNLPKEHKLSQFAASLPAILEATGYNEMYGVELVAPTDDKPAPHTTLLILQKYLRANVEDLEKAKEQLKTSLLWRKEYQPLKAKDEVYDANKFGGVGFVTKVKGAKETPNDEDVVCFNIYGVAAKDPKKTFGDLDAFVRWRVAMQEIMIHELKLNEANQTIPDYGKGPDPYKAINVHDYLSVSFLRRPPEITTSSKKIVEMFQSYYPETVSYKYFVNVPFVMQWMMGAMKALMSKDSIQTMTWMSYGNQLHQYLGDSVSEEYGGKGPTLSETAITPNYGNAEKTSTAKPAVVAEAAPATGVTTTAAQSTDAATAGITTTTPETSGQPAGGVTVA